MGQNQSNSITKQQIVSRFIFQNRVLFFASLLAATVNNFINVLIPLSIGWFYDVVLHDHGAKLHLLKQLPVAITTAKGFFIVFALLALVKLLAAYFDKYLVALLGERFSRDLRELAFSHQIKHTMQAHNLRPVGKYLLRYSGDLIAIQNLMSKGVLVFISDLVFLAFAFTTLFVINATLTLPVVVMFFIAAAVILLLSKYVRNAAWQRRSQRSLNLGWVSSRMHAFYTIKSFNRETPENNSFINRSRKLYKLGIVFARISAIVQALPQAFFAITLGIVLYFVFVLKQGNSATISNGNVFAFVLLLLYIQTVLKRFLKVTIVWQVGLVSFNKLLSLLQLPNEARSEENIMEEVKGVITFQNVDFAYTDKAVLNNLSFHILSNSITVIKGPQGSGKSTLLKLIQKMYEPQNGIITLDKVNYNNITAFELRKEITIVSAETTLLGGTVFKAISYNTADEKRDKAIAMLNRLNIKLAEGDEQNLDYKLEDGGKNIAVGERIMLQFARAFLTRKQIILIDDILVNLDAERKSIIIEQLNKLKKKRTIVIVSNDALPNLQIDQLITL